MRIICSAHENIKKSLYNHHSNEKKKYVDTMSKILKSPFKQKSDRYHSLCHDFFFAVLSLQRGANVVLLSRKADDPSFHFLIFVCSFLCFGGLTFNPKLLKKLHIMWMCLQLRLHTHFTIFSFETENLCYVIMDHWSFAYLRDIWSISDDGISSFGCLRKEIHAR